MMTKLRTYLKRFVILTVSLVLLVVGFGFWFFSLFPDSEQRIDLSKTLPSQIAYITDGVKESRGKILAVVTSSAQMGASGKTTGYELTELARAYYVFAANGFNVDIASPLGGTPPIVIDGDDMGRFDFAFLNDHTAQNKVNNSIKLSEIEPEQYQAVYFVGGKGAMFDFPDDPNIKSIVRNIFQRNKVVGAVCHGPAALVDIVLDDGTQLLQNKQISSFTNEEELFLIPDAEQIFPFLLQDKLTEQGANFVAGPAYLETISQEENLITGQNPWSVWKLAEAMVRQLGYEPMDREITDEEHSVDILLTYQNEGYAKAKIHVESLINGEKIMFNRTLLAMHSLVAIMQFEFGEAIDLMSLLAFAKR